VRPRHPLARAATALCAIAIASAAAPVRAIEDRADVDPNAPVSPSQPVAWKCTPALWHDSRAGMARDLNLRANTETETVWIGHYQRGGEFAQLRAGYEHQWSLPAGRLIASTQLASGGFAGGSLTLELPLADDTGWSGLAGWGRTNLRPYFNLNFDPNDSWLLGLSRTLGEARFTVYHLRDDRLPTGQQVTHLIWRGAAQDGVRWSAVLSRKAGWADPERSSARVQGTGLTVTREEGGWFVRLAWDPKVNYTPSDMLRLAVGLRF
jgi:hypothetical protein